MRLFGGQLLPQEVARHLVHALEDDEQLGANGTPEVRGRYVITLHPADLAVLQSQHPQLERELAEGLAALVRRMQIRLQQPPAVFLQAHSEVPRHEVRITPINREIPEEERTRDLDLSRVETLAERAAAERRAYLIVEGTRTYDLDGTVVRIGRSLDNGLILDDPRVSRHHAQLRRRYGRYLLQDLGSSGGTTVNGFPVQETILRPGDLISLAGVDLLYVEPTPVTVTASEGDTQPYSTVDR